MIRRLIPVAAAVALLVGCNKWRHEDEQIDCDPNGVYELKYRGPQQGDELEVSESQSMHIEFRKGTSGVITLRQRFEYVEQVLEMPAGARQPTKLTRAYRAAHCVVDFQEKGVASSAYRNLIRSDRDVEKLAGKTVNIAKKQLGYVYTVDGKILQVEPEIEIVNELRGKDMPGIEALLPKKAVKIGESWTIDPTAAKSFSGTKLVPEGAPKMSPVRFEGKLTRAYTRGGKRWGVVAFELQLASGGKSPGRGRSSCSYQLDGTLEMVMDGSAPDGTLKAVVKAASSVDVLDGAIDDTVERSVKSVK